MVGISLSEWVPGRLRVVFCEDLFSPIRAIFLRRGFYEGHAARRVEVSKARMSIVSTGLP